jgi:hypothetical protein
MCNRPIDVKTAAWWATEGLANEASVVNEKLQHRVVTLDKLLFVEG